MQHHMINKITHFHFIDLKNTLDLKIINKDSFVKIHNITDFKNLGKVTEWKARKQ